MKMKIFAVYDEKASAFLQPFFMQTRGQATRAFGDECRKPESSFGAHAEDFTLFEIGEYDQASGALLGHVPPQMIVLALSFREVSSAVAV